MVTVVVVCGCCCGLYGWGVSVWCLCGTVRVARKVEVTVGGGAW